MHSDNFFHIREYFLSHGSGIVEAPSGVPLCNILSHNWHVSYYGHFQDPISDFTRYPKPELAVAYNDPANHAEPVS